MSADWLILAVLAAVALGAWAWRERARWQRLERLLALWAESPHGAPAEGSAVSRLGECGHLLEKIAERHATLEREASDARFNLRAILASMEDGVVVADHRSEITLINMALRQMFAVKGQPIGQTVLTTLREPILQTMMQGVLQEGDSQQAEMELPAGTGRAVPLQIVAIASPMRDAAGLPGAVLVFRDVTRMRQLEEMRREFVANVSHELRTPLSIFQGYLENLLETDEPLGEEVRSGLLVMRKHALRLNALVEDLLILARLEGNRDTMQLELVTLSGFLAEKIEDWQGKAAAKGITLSIEAEDTLPAVPLDLLKIQQVLDNLLDNATKYTPSGGRVILRAVRIAASETDPAQVEVSVADTGAGIPREAIPHIFQRFYRADKARSRELGGTGLGLAIVKHIVQAHGGAVSAESDLGRGTRVILRLPLPEAN